VTAIGEGRTAAGHLSARPWRRLRLLILERDRGICGICGQPGATTVDHVRPRSQGGTNHPGNLRAAHARCNYGRGDRPAGQPVTTRSWL
jgi:5-methylcytosine-specific restriction endonuclease McrA